MKQLPAAVRVYKKTPTFDKTSVPGGLLREHRTKPGVWGRIRLQQGQLVYRILEPELEELTLTPDVSGIIEPEVAHELVIDGAVEFHVEFLK